MKPFVVRFAGRPGKPGFYVESFNGKSISVTFDREKAKGFAYSEAVDLGARFYDRTCIVCDRKTGNADPRATVEVMRLASDAQARARRDRRVVDAVKDYLKD